MGRPVRLCPCCGEKLEDQSSLAQLCYGCRLDTFLPPDYPARERYADLSALARATAEPLSGRAVLNGPRPGSVRELGKRLGLEGCLALGRWEAMQGLEHDLEERQAWGCQALER